MRIDVAGFLGANTHLNKVMLPDSVGTVSLNQAPSRGDLQPWRQPETVASVPPGRRTIYRMGRSSPVDGQHWLSWSTVVHAIRGFDREDTQERTYLTGATGGPSWTDNTLALASAPYPTATRPLGVIAPLNAPVLSIATLGSSTNEETRYYLTTFVNDLGWESAPSPPARIVCKVDAAIKLSSLENAASGQGINRRRIYRTKSGATGATEFFFYKELVYASGGQEWTEDGTALSNDVLQTAGSTVLGAWLPCPQDARCLTQLWNSMAAVISGKAVRPCVAGTLYAWPLDYEIVLSDTPVALAVWSQNLLVLTTGRVPSLITGQDPASLSELPLEGLPFNAACQSETSVVSYGHGVSWAGPDGLCYYGASGPKVITAGLIHPRDWRQLNPSSMVGCQFYGLAVVFFNDGTSWRGFIVDPINPTGVYWLSEGYAAAWADPLTSSMFVLAADGSIRKWDAGSALMTASFTSKAFRTPSINMAYARVIADAYPVTFKLIADGALAHHAVVQDDGVFGLPGGYEAQVWQIAVETSAGSITSAHMADNVEELAE